MPLLNGALGKWVSQATKIPHLRRWGSPKEKAGVRASVSTILTALNQKHRLCKWPLTGYLANMSTVQEIEAAIPRLSRAEIEEIRAWIDNFLEDQLELTDEVKAKLDESRREIAAGNYTTRQPK
jgi:pyridoxal/pyridoxine/pyridoxamine kinase